MTREETAVRLLKDDASPCDNESDRAFVVALARGLKVLDCFRDGDSMLTSHEIARRCKLSKPALFRLTHTLTTLGYLQYVEDATAFRLGAATMGLGSAALTQQDVRRMAQPCMDELAEFAGADVALAVRERMDMVCIQISRSRKAVTLSMGIGSRIPLARSAMGRAYLAAAPQDERDELLERLRDADELSWPQTKEIIDAAFAEYARTGCCVSIGEWQQGANQIAVAFTPGDRLPEMVIGVCGPALLLTPEHLREEIRPRLREVVRKMGFSPAVLG